VILRSNTDATESLNSQWCAFAFEPPLCCLSPHV
jgi:hypothetical protein